MKTCFKCGQQKERSEFYAHPRMADGLLGKCKECAKRDVHLNRLDNPERLSSYERSRYQNPARKKTVSESIKRQRQRNPQKSWCRQRTARAVKSGILKKTPCCVCGAEKVQAHHEDYSKPLEVKWMCFKCHREVAHGQVVVSQ